jgi:hypothetical protein
MTERTEIEQLSIDQALSGAISHHIRDVIQAATRTVQRLRPTDDNIISGMRESQLRNVVNVALDAQSVVEIAAFILYQMGRSTNSRQWQYNDFGGAVVSDLTADTAGGVVVAARNAGADAVKAIVKNGIELSDAEKQNLLADAHIALARQYLGYLNRLFYFADKARGWDRLTMLAEADYD